MLELEVADISHFDNIYKDMLTQFPETELKSYEDFCHLLKNDDYKLILASDNNEYIGYLIVFFDRILNFIWLDYIAVLQKFHSCGYGGKMVDGLKDIFPELKGCFLEVEKPDVTHPDTLRRIKFYEKHGAVLLDVNYLYPNKSGFLPMDLYFIPYKEQVPVQTEIFDAVKNIFGRLHMNFAHTGKVYDLIVSGTDET